MEQHIFIREVGNLKHDGGELLHIFSYVVCLLQLPKLALCLIDDFVGKNSFLNSSRNCSQVLMMQSPSISQTLKFLDHIMAISERYYVTDFILFSSFFSLLNSKYFSKYHWKFSTSCTSQMLLSLLGSINLGLLYLSSDKGPPTSIPTLSAFISAFMVLVVLNASMRRHPRKRCFFPFHIMHADAPLLVFF